MNVKVMFASAILSLVSFVLAAGEDIPVNGDFKGATEKNIPGWILRQGAVKAVYAGDGEYAVELQNGAQLISEAYPVTGELLELKAEVRGNGFGRITYIIFDRAGHALKHHSDRIRFSAQSRKSKVRALFNIPREAATLSIELVADKNSTVIFEDVEAEFERPRKVLSDSNAMTPLVDERRYRLADLGKEIYAVTLAPGKDVEFKLEEADVAKWQVKSADSNICRVYIEHDRDGIWPLRRYDAEVEIKALRRGKCEVVLQHASGKEMKIAVQVN